MSDSDEAYGRRLSDRVARWMEVVLLGALSLLLGIIIYFYGGMPQKIGELVTVTQSLTLEVSYMKEEIRELKDASRVSQGWRDRQVQIEQRVERNTEHIADIDRRVEKLEQPLSIFGPGKKK